MSSTVLVLNFWLNFDFEGIEEWQQIRPKGGSPQGEFKCTNVLICTGGMDIPFVTSTIGPSTECHPTGSCSTSSPDAAPMNWRCFTQRRDAPRYQQSCAAFSIHMKTPGE